MQCAGVVSQWFTGVRLSLLCGGGEVASRVEESRTISARASPKDEQNNNNNNTETGEIERDWQQLLERVARDNGFQRPKYEMKSATKAGDNYTGRVLRAVIHEAGPLERPSLSLIFKAAPVSQVRRNVMRSGLLFHNEGSIYQNVLPAYNEFLKEYGLSSSDTYPATARCFATKLSDGWTDNAVDILVLEDMAPRGYVMVEKMSGLKADVVRLVLQQLARLHATSMAFRHLRPDDAARVESSIRETLFIPGNPLINDLGPLLTRSLSFVEERYPSDTTEYKKVKKLVDHFGEVMPQLVSPDDQLSCVVHGDCWSNNVLFKLKDGDIEDACLIDFQLSRIASPVLDIVYLIFGCTTKKTRDDHYQELLEGYHAELQSMLTSMGCDIETIIPWTLFEDHLKAYGKYGMVMALIILPVILAESSEVPNLDEMLEQEKGFSNICAENGKNQLELKNRICDVIEDCVRLGYL